MMNDPDRLDAAPRQAATCQHCSCPMFPPRCAACGWVDAGAVVVVEDDGDDGGPDDDDTDLLPVLDIGGSD